MVSKQDPLTKKWLQQNRPAFQFITYNIGILICFLFDSHFLKITFKHNCIQKQ